MNRLPALFLLIVIALLTWQAPARADVIRLHLPVISDSPKQHHYFHELLSQAIENIGHTPEFITHPLPQLRAKRLLSTGFISVFWMVESAQRNKDFMPIDIGITNGLIGKRILFIKDGDQPLYDQVKTLQDFRELNLIGGMGTDWFDTKVWRANNLMYLEQSGNWKAIFKMIPRGRNYNYFSRGISEILVEAKQYPKLAIENKLVLIYDRDFLFYLSKSGPQAGIKHHQKLWLAMKRAKEEGLIERLVLKYWAKDFETLNYEQRTKIHLATPD